MIGGFERPTAGEILLDGVDVAQTPPHKRNVHTVFQSYALFPHLTVADNVAFGLRRQPDAEGRDHAAASRRRSSWSSSAATASGARRSCPAASSSGSRSRGRSCCARRVLLLDEPLGALDAKIRKQLRIELKALQEEVGITFVFVTHDQEEALSMSDRVAVMSAGGSSRSAPPPRSTRTPRPCSSPTSSACRT